jgi:hypothetical protein
MNAANDVRSDPMLEYRYPHFRRRLIFEDMSFQDGPAPGDPMPDFELPTSDGRIVHKADYVGRRPVLFTMGSITCPMTAASRDILKGLYREYGDRVEFVTLYVREAHPGDLYPQAVSLEQKIDYARVYRDRDGIPWTVAVDDVEGALHRALDAKPNAAFIMDFDGTVAYRTLWSNHQGALRKGLRLVADEGRGRAPAQTQSHVVPMLSGMGRMYEMLVQSGPTAKRDVLRQAPPMYLMARVAALFRPLPPLARGIAAMITTGLGVLAIAWGVRRLSQDGR